MGTPVEIERKYVIKKPKLSDLTACEEYSVSEIRQTYLESEDGVTHRVRMRRYQDGVLYTETKKVRIDKISSYEDERQIDEAEYLRLLSGIKKGTRTLRKTRHAFSYLGQSFEIDIYPEWSRAAIMETELSRRDFKVSIPPFISVVAEVSGDFRYSNAAMSKEFPKEPIEL